MAPVDARKKLEQIRRSKGKERNANVTDLRQIISRKTNKKGNDRSPGRVVTGRINKNQLGGGVRDLRDTNRRLASRKSLAQQQTREFNSNPRAPTTSRIARASFDTDNTSRPPAHNTRSTISTRPIKVGRPQQQYYVPPHVQNALAGLAPSYIFTSAPSNLAMDRVQQEPQGASILVSNLIPTITQSDVIELFGDIGDLTAVNMINQTTALVTYRDSSDAVKAVKVYHNRLLDKTPMLVNMMPNTTAPVTSNVRSRVGYAPIVRNSPAQMEISW